jgi:hypothetical protein
MTAVPPVSADIAEPIDFATIAPDAHPSDRRTATRHPYRVVQRMAPWDGKSALTESEFSSIRCHDISTGGMSFAWATKPTFQYVVLALKNATSETYVLAQVSFYHRHPLEPEQFLVGSRFVRRLK